MSSCARPGCRASAKSSCSGCAIEQYCGSDCQKLDWKSHKSLCSILKRLSRKRQPFDEVVLIIAETLASEKGFKNIRVLKHLLLYADCHFGKKITGLDYRERDDQRISNWDVDFGILKIHRKIVDVYGEDTVTSMSLITEKRLPHLEISIEILRPWLLKLDQFDSSDKNKRLNDHQIFDVLYLSFRVEHGMAVDTMLNNQYDLTEGHCRRCLDYSKRLGKEGELKTTSIFQALSMNSSFRQNQGRYSEAVSFAEEGYNLVVIAYDPVHPQVQVC
jgi:hypothetical protein